MSLSPRQTRTGHIAKGATKKIEDVTLGISMNFSFSITDLKKSIPGAEALASLSGEELLAGVRRVLGDAAKDSVVTVDGDIVTVTPNPVAVANSAEAARLSERAAARARKGELDKAAGIYRRVLELDPTRHDSRRELAMVLVEMGKAAEAVDVLLDVLKVNPLDHQALIILGNHYAREKRDLVTATRFFERAAEVAPDDPVVQNSIAAMLFEQKKPDEALARFNRVLELNPRFAHALYGKSMVLMTEGRFADAIACLDQLFHDGDLAMPGSSRCLAPPATITGSSPTSSPTTRRARPLRWLKTSRLRPSRSRDSRSWSRRRNSMGPCAR